MIKRSPQLKWRLIENSNLISKLKIIALLFLFSLFASPNAQAVVAFTDSNEAAVNKQHFSKKAKKKIRRWQKRLLKWTKAKDGKVQKNKFGRIGLLILLGGILSLIVFDGLFLLALLGSAVFGLIGLKKDEKKLAAILALALPVVFLAIVFIAVANSFGR